MIPSLLIIKPEPTEVAKRSLALKGSKEIAEIDTTEGETFLKISGTDSVQADLANAPGFTVPSKTKVIIIKV
jgi:hypothetical protein